MLSSLLEFLSGIPFFTSPAFGIMSMIIVGSSGCLIGFIMGDAPKRGIEPSIVQLLGFLCACIFSIPAMIITDGVPQCSWQITAFTCGVIGIGGFMNFFMLQIMSYAMQKGPNGVIWAVIQSALVFPFIGGIVFFDVQLTWARGFGIVCLLAALVLFAMTKDNANSRGGWKIPALICLLITAIQQNLTTMPSYFQEARAVGSIVRTLAASVGGLSAALIYDLVKMDKARWQKLCSNMKNPVLWRYTVALQLFNLIFAYTLFYPGMNAMADAGLGGMSYPMMVGSCIVSFSITAVLLLKEKFTMFQFGALIICISGLVLICIPTGKTENPESCIAVQQGADTVSQVQ
ncbi:MAG: hypothetical protein IJC27_05480 [Lentisphaeria bacterium]|nr:hypothetical protein [Lentisphaeria bacterium]